MTTDGTTWSHMLTLPKHNWGWATTTLPTGRVYLFDCIATVPTLIAFDSATGTSHTHTFSGPCQALEVPGISRQRQPCDPRIGSASALVDQVRLVYPVDVVCASGATYSGGGNQLGRRPRPSATLGPSATSSQWLRAGRYWKPTSSRRTRPSCRPLQPPTSRCFIGTRPLRPPPSRPTVTGRLTEISDLYRSGRSRAGRSRVDAAVPESVAEHGHPSAHQATITWAHSTLTPPRNDSGSCLYGFKPTAWV